MAAVSITNRHNKTEYFKSKSLFLRVDTGKLNELNKSGFQFQPEWKSGTGYSHFEEEGIQVCKVPPCDKNHPFRLTHTFSGSRPTAELSADRLTSVGVFCRSKNRVPPGKGLTFRELHLFLYLRKTRGQLTLPWHTHTENRLLFIISCVCVCKG